MPLGLIPYPYWIATIGQSGPQPVTEDRARTVFQAHLDSCDWWGLLMHDDCYERARHLPRSGRTSQARANIIVAAYEHPGQFLDRLNTWLQLGVRHFG